MDYIMYSMVIQTTTVMLKNPVSCLQSFLNDDMQASDAKTFLLDCFFMPHSTEVLLVSFIEKMVL